MGKHCEICGKKHTSGNFVSHAKNRTKRRFLPNLQRVKAIVKGIPTIIYACTRCIRSGKIAKASV